MSAVVQTPTSLAPLAGYITAFERSASSLPAAEQAARSAHFERFLQHGFPTRKVEDWRYSDLSALAALAVGSSTPAEFDAHALLLDDADHLVYVNGRLQLPSSTAHWHADHVPPRLSAIPDAMAGNPAMDALNAAFATPGIHLHLGRNEQLTRPLQVVLASIGTTPDAMTHQRHRIELDDHAEATLLLDFVATGSSHLATHSFEVHLGDGARLTMYRVQDASAGATLITRIEVLTGRNARFEAVTIDHGLGFVRHDIDVHLGDKGAVTELDGLYAAGRGAHIDNHLRVSHAAPQGTSRMHYRGLVEEKTRAVFNGKVVVQPGAQKTSSEQRIANLLLSRKAEVNAKPDLEIYADDVKCAHGATVGQLDETALAYLRSRGIPRETARALLLRAFALEILDRLAWPGLRARIEARLQLPTEFPLELNA